ncbi:NAD(P)/FAD-dependent oxidoreductase [Kiloniella laminariae]|uniref:NAD(P)/FAD-dependent oxidoreductase n=1 Tax=Kiloniella laminariae TaxID=454162 RepID=UPI0004754764|nr:FAD-binding oxidoreductase [Kiloniella laminariae]
MTYPDTYYSRTAIDVSQRPSLTETLSADVCIIGGGLAGLSCAQELINRGKSVVVLESRRVAWGASGRNGGFVTAGFAGGEELAEQRLGMTGAKQLFDLSREGVDIVRNNIQTLNLKETSPSPGKISVIRYHDPDSLQRYCDKMARDYGHELTYLSKADLPDYMNTDRYHQGYLDNQGFHFHPLNYCLGLARVIEQRGGKIFEDCEVLSMDQDSPVKSVTTARGKVNAQDIVLCGGGYSGKVFDKVRRSLLPITTYVVVTEKIGPLLQECIKTGAAILDDRMASDYYRIVDEDRLLWGGRVTTRTSEPKDLAALLRQDMLDVYPALAGVKIETAWSGLMAYARHKMPYIGEIKPGVWTCTAFGGHGMNTAPIGGRLIAEAITGESSRYKLFKAFDLQWNGGPAGPLVAQSVYWGLKLTDWWNERKSVTR